MPSLFFLLLAFVTMKSEGLGTRLVEKGELRVNFQLAFEGLAMLIFTFANIVFPSSA